MPANTRGLQSQCHFPRFVSQGQSSPWGTLSSHWHFQNGNTGDMKSPSLLKVLLMLKPGHWLKAVFLAPAELHLHLLMQEFVIIKFRTSSNCCREKLISQMCTEGASNCPLKGRVDPYTILKPGHCFNLPQIMGIYNKEWSEMLAEEVGVGKARAHENTSCLFETILSIGWFKVIFMGPHIPTDTPGIALRYYFLGILMWTLEKAHETKPQ